MLEMKETKTIVIVEITNIREHFWKKSEQQ